MASIPSIKSIYSSFPPKHFDRKQSMALPLCFQGETGLRGEIGNPGRDGARVSRILFSMFVLKFCFCILLSLNSANFKFNFSKTGIHYSLDH